MEFTPIQEQTDDAVYDNLVFDTGEYEFKVVSAQSSRSKAGNDMIKIGLSVFDNGRQIKVYDYLLEAMMFKLKHFCEAVGLEKEYASGTLTPQMCSGKTGRLKLSVQVDRNGKYPDKNIVEDYCTEEETVWNG